MSNAIGGVILMLADAVPEEVLIEQIQESIDKWKEGITLNKSEEEMENLLQQLTLPCILFLTKMNNKGKNIMEAIKEFDQFSSAHNLLSTGKD